MLRGAPRASLAVGLLALAGSLAPACGRSPELAPVTVIELRTTDLAPALAEAGIDGAATAEIARSALASAGLRIDERARRGYRATVEVIAVSVAPARRDLPATAEIMLELKLEQTWAAGPAPRRTGRGRAPLDGPGRVDAWRSALRQAAVEAASAAALDLRALQRTPERLVADLSSADPRARERAARALASKGVRGSVGAIALLVRDPDPAVARAAVDAVAAFRDPASAVALIDAAQAGDVATTLRLIPVLGELGGADVEGYLLTLEAGHGDPAVRRAAGDALARLRGGRRPGGNTP
jgi:HEAT repeat protein